MALHPGHWRHVTIRAWHAINIDGCHNHDVMAEQGMTSCVPPVPHFRHLPMCTPSDHHGTHVVIIAAHRTINKVMNPKMCLISACASRTPIMYPMKPPCHSSILHAPHQPIRERMVIPSCPLYNHQAIQCIVSPVSPSRTVIMKLYLIIPSILMVLDIF